MREAVVVVLSVGLLASCSSEKADPARAAIALRDRMAPCVQDQAAQRSALMEAVFAGARDPQYAEQAKQSAIACRQVREALERTNPRSPCIRVAQAFEVFGWEMNAAFEGRTEFSETTSVLNSLEEPMTACLAELPPPPPETPEQTAAREKAEAEVNAAMAEAEAASQAAADASAEASAAQAELANAMRGN